jgi:hypothetical protein
LFDPADALSEKAFDALDSDPLYRQLCKSQKCYRARLTPKPWRCGIPQRPERWPWPDAKIESRFQQWQSRYAKASDAYATCALITVIGNREVHPDIQPIVNLHDEATRAGSKLPLA